MHGTYCWRGGLSLKEGEIKVLSVSSLFLTWVGVLCVYVCISADTLIRTACGALGCEPRGRDEARGEPEDSRWTQFWHICIRTCGQSAHVIYVCLAAIKSELTDFFSSNRNFLPNKNVKRCERNTENSNPTGFELIDPP